MIAISRLDKGPARSCLSARWLAGTAISLALVTTPSFAFTDSLIGCDAPSLDRTEDFLRDQGYERVQEFSSLTPSQSDNVAWTLMDAYLDQGDRRADRGGEDIDAILDLQRRAVPGLFRKVDTDATRFRLYVRGDDVMTISEADAGDGSTRRTCRLALGLSSADVVSATRLDTEGHPDAPARGLYTSSTILPEE